MSIIRQLALCAFIVILFAAVAPAAQVVVYTAVDQVYSEPVLKAFEKQTGIKVKAVYDIEAVKTTGLANRLLAERDNPRCDVFWNNEVVRSIVLKRNWVLQPYFSPRAHRIDDRFKDKAGFWTGFAARARVIVIHKGQSEQAGRISSILDLASPWLRGKVAVANPLFGTTATHVAALFALWGPQEAQRFLLNLKANQARVVDGNSVVRDMVGSGAVLAGLTDTDDANVGIKAGLPMEIVLPDQEGMGTLVIPNTVAMVADCPHPKQARALIDYLLSAGVEQALAESLAVQMPLGRGVTTRPGFLSLDRIKAMKVDYDEIADQMKPAAEFVRRHFLR